MHFHFKWPKNFGPRIVKPGAPRAQRSEDMHSRRGSPQTRASSSIPHRQAPPPASSGAAAKAGCPAPAEGSRGPPTPSEIPSLPQATPPRNTDPRAQVPHRAPRMQSGSLAWAGRESVASGSSAEGLRDPDPSLASLELGSQFQASQLGGCGQHGSRDRLAGQPPVAGLCFIPLGSQRGRSLG